MNVEPRFFRVLAAILSVSHCLSGVGVQMAFASSGSTNRYADTIAFTNGDKIGGRLIEVSSAGVARWENPDAEKPMLFSTENLTQLDLDGRGGDATSGATWKLRFDNDDELSVRRLAFVGEQQIELESSFLGKIVTQRRRVKNLAPIQTNFVTLFEGPSSTNGWTSWKVVSALGEPGEWKYHSGAFYAKEASSIARPLNLPESFSMEFDLKWKGPLNVAIAIFTDSLKPISLANKEDEPDFAGFYSLQINSFGANLLSVRKRDPLRYLGQQAIPGMAAKTKAHFEIKADKRSRRILFFVDGVLVKQWNEPSEFSGEGRGIRLVHQGQGSVRLSALRVTEWDGRFEDRVPTSALPPTGDIILMLDGERITGTIQSIQSGQLVLNSGSGPLNKSIQSIRAVELRPNAAPTANSSLTLPASNQTPSVQTAKPLGEAHVYFQKHGRLHLILERLENGKLHGTSPILGKVEVDSNAISRIVMIRK